MISNVIQILLNPVIDAYQSIIQTDEYKSIACIHSEEVQDVLQDKQEVYGYVFNVTVDIIAPDLETIGSLSSTIIIVLSNLSQSIDSTTIEESELTSSLGPNWNDEAKTYINTLNFKFQTKNL